MQKKTVQEALKEVSTKIVAGDEVAQSTLEDLLKDNWSTYALEETIDLAKAPRSWENEIWASPPPALGMSGTSSP